MVIKRVATKLMERTNTPQTKAKPAIKMLDKAEIENLIREQAYKLYVQRGCTPGNPEDDWREAERIVRQM